MHRNLRGLALRGALGGLMVAAGLMGAPAFASAGHAHRAGPSTNANTTNAHVKLDAAPAGSAALTWNRASSQLSVGLSFTGLTPGAAYAASIEKGSCKQGGTQLYPLTGLTADTHGDASSQTTLTNVTSPIPAHGWIIAVQQGATMVACGQVPNVHTDGHKGRGHSASKDVTEKAIASLNATLRVGGEGHLQIQHGTLTIDLHAHGLASGASYPAEIGQGTCALLGNSIQALTPLAQNARGDWSSTTTHSGVTSIPAGPWYVAIWSANHSALLACGNLQMGGHN